MHHDISKAISAGPGTGPFNSPGNGPVNGPFNSPISGVEQQLETSRKLVASLQAELKQLNILYNQHQALVADYEEKHRQIMAIMKRIPKTVAMCQIMDILNG